MARTILFFTWLWLSLVVTSPVCLLYLVLESLGLGPLVRPVFQLGVRAWAKSLAAVAGMSIRAEGLDRIPLKGPICLVANHVGYMDIVLVLACVRRTVGFVAKAESALFPFFNLWIVALGSVFLDRRHVGRAKRAIDLGVKRIAAGRAFLVFPEGTRSRGGPVGPFHHGSFKLATRAGALIVPVTIKGTAQVWEQGRVIRPASVDFIVHEPLPTAGIAREERTTLPERVRAIIAGEEAPLLT